MGVVNISRYGSASQSRGAVGRDFETSSAPARDPSRSATYGAATRSLSSSHTRMSRSLFLERSTRGTVSKMTALRESRLYI